MAKLGTYYGLCPLIDHRSLLGISEDEEPGVVIVTLGKNIAIKYRLSDQKQLHSWRTKEKFTSPIIYDRQQSKYLAVFNESYIRLWTGNEEFLDKLKKFKFSQPIYTIFMCNGQSFILFKNGALHQLGKAIVQRKELNAENVIDLNVECISEALHCSYHKEVYVGLIVKSSRKENCLYWTKFDASGQQEKFSKVSLKRNDLSLTGHVLYVTNNSVNFLSLWSDGKMFSTELKDSEADSADFGELFTVIEALSCKEYVSLMCLDQNYIALYGCNSNEEGALLAIYNVQFKVLQSKQPFKLFTKNARLWRTDDRLMFPVGQNLAVIPFYLDTEQLAALVGSHKIVEIEPDPDVCIVQKVQVVSWGNDSVKSTDVPAILKPKIEDLLNQGLSENTLFETLLSGFAEEKNVEILAHALRYFNDIPEQSLANVIKIILNLEEKWFKNGTPSSFKGFPENLQPLEKAQLLDIVFSKAFNETLLLPYMRSVLTIGEALTLLQYIYFLLSENGHLLPSLDFAKTEAKLIEWCCIIIDANYQKFLLTRDDTVNEVLLSLQGHFKEELSCFDDLLRVLSLLNEVKKKKVIQKRIHLAGLNYSVEEFPLY